MSGDCLDEDLHQEIHNWLIDDSVRRFVRAGELLARIEPLAEAALANDAPLCEAETARLVGLLLLQQTGGHDAVLRYVAKHLGALSAHGSLQDIARTLSPTQWTTILSAAPADDALQFLTSLPSDTPKGQAFLGNILLALAPRLQDRNDKRRTEFVRLASARFPECTITSSHGNVDTFEVVAAYALKDDFDERRGAWASWVERWASSKPFLSGTLKQFRALLSQTLAEDGLANRVLEGMSAMSLADSALHCRPLFDCLVDTDPSGVADVIALGLRPTLTNDAPLSLGPFIDAGILGCVSDLVPELAYLVAKAAVAKRVDPEGKLDPKEYLRDPVPLATDIAERVAAVARIWLYVLSLEPSSRSSRWTRNAWAFKAIRTFLHESEREWLGMLRVMRFVLDDTALAIIEEVTLTELASSERLRDALDDMRGSRDPRLSGWARDLTAHRTEIAAVNEGSLTTFSRIARYIDRGSIFPHPLKLTSSTWFASPEAEGVLRSALDAAAESFGRARQLGEEEEVITRDLLRDIADALRNANVVLRGFGPSHSLERPLLDVRQETKHYEKGKGLDAAVIVNVDLPGHLRASWTSFIQAKKAHRDDTAPGQFVDTWTLVTQQVRDLIASCEDSIFIFYAPNGESYVVAARLICAILEGKGRMTEETATIHYCEFRSMAITLSQYLVDLVIGGWYGSRSDHALKIAHGSDLANRPSSVLKVTFAFAKED